MRDAKITQIYEGTNEIQRARDRAGDALTDATPPRRIVFAAVIALCLGLTAVVVLQGFSTQRAGEGDRDGRRRSCSSPRALFGGAISSACGWPTGRSPSPRRSSSRSCCAPSAWRARASRPSPTRPSSSTSTPTTTTTSRSSCATRSTTCPTCCAPLIENHNVAVVISDGGRRRRAYGLYHGDGATRDDVPDRIVIYRDTLRRDFGHDPDLLREQVTHHGAPRARPPRRLRRARRARPRALGLRRLELGRDDGSSWTPRAAGVAAASMRR